MIASLALSLDRHLRSRPMPGEHVNQYERAFRAWPLLTATAERRSTITYAELADHLDIHPRPIRYVLAVIQDWCLREKKPPLTILVVSQSRGRPGQGFIAWDVNDLDEGYQQVYSFRWSELANPFEFADDGATLEELAHRLVTKPEDAADVYRQVKNRGFAEVVFRLALLAAYRRRCAFCGLSLRDALQAAHIIPWSKASLAERVSPSNGLLLCATHHLLFDADILSVTTNRKIACLSSKVPGHRWTNADRRVALILDGQPVELPADPRLCPSDAALAYRAARLKD
jgi:putative restriction endonuclease